MLPGPQPLRAARSSTPGCGSLCTGRGLPDASYSVVHLAPAAERALKERRGLLIKHDGDGEGAPAGVYHIAYLIEAFGKMQGAVVVEALGPSDHDVQSVARNLHWGAAWLEVMLRRADAATSGEAHERLQKAA